LLARCGANEYTENSRTPPSTRQNVWYADHRDSPFCDTKLVIEHGELHITSVSTKFYGVYLPKLGMIDVICYLFYSYL
jgi:hypothetical protein